MQDTTRDAFTTVDYSYFQEEPKITKIIEAPKTDDPVQLLNTPPVPDQNLYQPAVSDVSDDTPSAPDPKYNPGLLIFADKNGI